MIHKIVQSGNYKQANQNGIPDWEYIFGIQKIKTNSNSYDCSKHGEVFPWSIKPRYATTFQLHLIY